MVGRIREGREGEVMGRGSEGRGGDQKRGEGMGIRREGRIRLNI